MSQSYRKHEITTTFEQEICRNLTFSLRLRQVLMIKAQIKDFKKGNKALVSNKNWTLMFSDLEVVALSLSALRAELMPGGCLISSCRNNHISVLTRIDH